ncbi:MAG: HAMP domain-containing sensor histidine kinase [Romboutsia sp.]
MKNINKVMILFAMIFIIVSANSTISLGDKLDNNKPTFNVLIINSYHQGHYWERYISEGLNDGFSEFYEYDFNIQTEYLDFKNQGGKKYIDSVMNMMENKYPKGSIDAIYAVDDEAYNFLRNKIIDENSNFYDIPFVFSGVNKDEDSTKVDDSLKIGLYGEDDTFELIKLIQNLNPEVENINLIMEDSDYGESIATAISKFTNTHIKKKPKLNYIKTNYIENIVQRLIHIQDTKNTVNIVAGEFQYEDSKKYLKPYDTINIIKKYNSGSIYSNDNTYLDAGILGGCIDLGRVQGEYIAEIIVYKMEGKNIIDKYPIVEPKANTYINFNTIKEYKVNTKDISSDIIIRNKKFYETLLPKEIGYGIVLILILISIAVLLWVQDYLKMKKLSLVQRQKQKEKEDRDNLKTDFIVNLSHELRTPINIIRNSANIINIKLESKEIDKDVIRDTLEIISNNSCRLLKISNNIIDITSAESGLFKIKLKNENIVDVVEEAFCASIKFANIKNIEMIFDTEYEEIITAIDIEQIQRVVLNLLSNAIKYTNDYGKIHLGINKINNNVEIKVKDTGIGIPKDKLDNIFYRFYQLDYSTTRINEGSGIGLCIVKDIINIHNGKIEVESDMGIGSCFRIYIPIKNIDIKENESKVVGYDVNTIASVEMADIIR